MTGTEWLASLSDPPTSARNQAVIDAVNNGLLQFDWIPVVSNIVGHTAIFQVLSDAAYVILDDGSRYRPMTTAPLLQKIADMTEASLMTAKIYDLAYLQATIKTGPTFLPASLQMGYTHYSVHFNQIVENKRNGQDGLMEQAGKAWIIDELLERSGYCVNFGFNIKGAPYSYQGISGYQRPPSHAHQSAIVSKNPEAFLDAEGSEQDYSQIIYLMQSACSVDGDDSTVQKVLSDPELCGLASYTGVLKYLKQP